MREAGAAQPILLLEGVFEADELPLCARLGFEVAVDEPGQLGMLEVSPRAAAYRLAQGRQRHEPAGLSPGGGLAALGRLRGCASLAPGIRLMTHFSSADELASGDPGADRTLPVTAQSLDLERSFCNSAGVLAWPEAHAEWIRPGVMLYGVSPMAGRTGRDEELRPVMTLTTRLISVKQVPAGERSAMPALGRRRRQPDRHRRHRLRRRLPAPRRLRHAGAGRRQAGHARRPGVHGHARDPSNGPSRGAGRHPVTLWGAGLPIETIASHAAPSPTSRSAASPAACTSRPGGPPQH